jgi:drug/metabolite transporter (DMT)-like permease
MFILLHPIMYLMKFSPFLAVIIAATLGGFSGVFFKWIDLPATTLTFFRVAVPTAVLFLYLKGKKIQFLGATTNPCCLHLL